ncbi:hypothetical protein ACFFGR_06530 [Arthrobacter liuii]|uniref:hypothetical protein n=1 Tax=Arthrobacter liuii TaxID=1476996 RepID=UPI0035E533C6
MHPVRVGWLVEADSKKRFEELAERSGVSGAVFFERVVEHLEKELTDQGIPNWWPEQGTERGELPIDTA